jgi:transcriptional regulator with XRE-family HTH domain
MPARMNAPADLRTVSGRLKAARVLANLSWKQMGYRLGVKDQTCKAKEIGRRAITGAELAIWAKYTRCSVDWLVTGVGKEPAGLERIDHVRLDGTEHRKRRPSRLELCMAL